jgi:hypothetical protein
MISPGARLMIFVSFAPRATSETPNQSMLSATALPTFQPASYDVMLS